MQVSQRASCALLLSAVLALLPASAVRADAGSDYGSIVRDAVREYNAGNWSEARLLFGKAHAIAPSARTFRGLGLTAFELKQYVASIAALEAALADAAKPLTAEQRSEVERVLARAGEFAAVYRLRVSETVTTVVVDGKAIPIPENQLLQLDPGDHVVTIHLSGEREVSQRVLAEVGARGDPVFEVSQLSTASDDAADLAARQAPPPVHAARTAGSEPKAEQGGRVLTWIAAGATGVFAAGAIALGVITLDKQDDSNAFTRECTDCTRDQITDAQDEARRYQLLTNVSIGLAAASAVTAVVLFFTETGGPVTSTSAEGKVALSFAPGAVQVRGAF